MLLPEHALGVKRVNGGRVMLAPAALPHLCPALGCLPCVHVPRVGKGADSRRPGGLVTPAARGPSHAVVADVAVQAEPPGGLSAFSIR